MPRRTILFSMALLVMGCGGSANVTLRMSNDTLVPKSHPKSTIRYGAPSYLGMKLVAAYLVEDVDPASLNNIGNVAMIWLNPACQGNIDGCGTAESLASALRDFFDFARPTAEVNAALNAQGHAVPTGTYRYARLEFCKYGAGTVPNVQWAASEMAAPHGFVSGECGVTSEAFAEPIVLTAGDSVAVTLSYDLGRSVRVGPSGGGGNTCFPDPEGAQVCYRDCLDEGGSRICFNPPLFQPGAVTGQGGSLAQSPPAR